MLPILYLILIRRNGSPYPEVTVVSLPSSLMIVHSNAFVFSTSLLVVVSRYGFISLIILLILKVLQYIRLLLFFQNPLHFLLIKEGCYYVTKICSSFNPLGW